MLMLNRSGRIDGAAECKSIKLERYAGIHQICGIISPLFLSVHATALPVHLKILAREFCLKKCPGLRYGRVYLSIGSSPYIRSIRFKLNN